MIGVAIATGFVSVQGAWTVFLGWVVLELLWRMG